MYIKMKVNKIKGCILIETFKDRSYYVELIKYVIAALFIAQSLSLAEKYISIEGTLTLIMQIPRNR